MSDDILSPDQLAKVSKLFELLDDTGRKRLLNGGEKRSYAASTVICQEGEAGEEFYVVLKGRLSVEADDFGTAKPIANLGPGAFFGEMAVVGNQPRSATVTAKEDTEVLAFGRATVEEILKDYPAVRTALGKVGVKRAEELMEKLSS
jgi:CRP-like cAMP-binding protein